LAKKFQIEKCDIACPSCEKTNRERGELKRQRPVGKLQTFVVLQNGGPNPDGIIDIL
jgi:transposase-like protein